MYKSGKFYIRLGLPDGASFPTSPNHGDIFLQNGIAYTYLSGISNWRGVADYLSGDVSIADGVVTVIQLQNRPIADIAPGDGEALVWDGAQWIPSGIYASGISPGQYLLTTGARAGATGQAQDFGANGITADNIVMGGSVNPVLEINPSHVDTCRIIQITPNAAITTIDTMWDGIRVDGAALDPSVVDVEIMGMHIALSGVAVDQLPHIDGLFIDTPLTYHREYNHAIRTRGGGIWVDWDATTSTTVDTFTAINVVVQTDGANDGDVHILDVARGGTGTVEVTAVGTHGDVGVIHQHVGTFIASAKAWKWEAGPTWTDITASLAGTNGDVEIFSADNDLIYISGMEIDVTFDELQVLLSTLANKSIKPKFEYSVAGPGWTQFYPTDDTRGFEQNGTIRWESANLTGWAQLDVNASGDGRYWIRITRQRNNLATPPIADSILVLDATAYYWSKTGNIKALDATFMAGIALEGASAANILTVPDGAVEAFNIKDDGGLEYLRVDSTNDYLLLFPGGGGNVGIGGEVAPVQPLHLIGAFQHEITGDSNVNYYIVSDAVRKGVIVYRATDDALKIAHAEAGATAVMNQLVIKEGNVGIGTVVPLDNIGTAAGDFSGTGLHVKGAGTTRLILEGNVPVQLWVDSAGDADDKILGLVINTGKGTFRTYDDDTGIGIDNILVMDLGTGNVGIGAVTPAAKFHADQSVDDAAIPVLTLDQADVSEEMIEFITTIGVGNAIEAVGGKALTTTHFIKVTLPGPLTRYIPVGTIA